MGRRRPRAPATRSPFPRTSPRGSAAAGTGTERGRGRPPFSRARRKKRAIKTGRAYKTSVVSDRRGVRSSTQRLTRTKGEETIAPRHARIPRRPPPKLASVESRHETPRTRRSRRACRTPLAQGRKTCGVMRTRAKRPRVAHASKSICTHAGRLQGNHRPAPAAACFSLSLCLSVSVSLSLSLSRMHSLSRLAGCATRCTALKAQYVTNT